MRNINREIYRITNREQEIIKLVVNEFNSKEIANQLYISTETVNSHRKNIRRKFGAKNVAGVVSMAFRLQLVC